MYRLPELLLILSGLMSLSACVTSPAEKPAYTVDILNFSSTSRGAEKPVIAMIATPLEAKGPLPVIITQHGSSRDGIGFPGGEGHGPVHGDG